MRNIGKSMNHQEGAALAIGLILLLIITLMGYTGMKGTILQEKMAAGLHNRSLANSGSNSALRAGESFLYDLIEITNGVNVRGTPDGRFNNLYSAYDTIEEGQPVVENPVLTSFLEKNWSTAYGTEHSYDFINTPSYNGKLKTLPKYLIHEVVFGGETGVSAAFDESGFGADGSVQRSFIVTGKSQSGDGKSLAMMQSLYTVVAGSGGTN